jgi:adenine-specific DNA-methyltransferase
MDKLKLTSTGTVPGNVAKIAALFPNCVTEVATKITKPDGTIGYESRSVVDFDKLKEELSTELVEGAAERYQFTWPDKRAANHLANTPTTMTLRPCEEESVGKDGTNGVFDSENLYIEGDNLDVLKVLRETYLGKIKMIYIDPPYNTGNDFVYNDDFTSSYDEFAESCKVYDEDGNLTFDPKANNESNGRFHTDWLNMIYPRLKVARDLLTEDGVIFISIDDNEIGNLRKLCDEIYGVQNFVATCVRKRRDSQANLSKNISPIHEYVVIYARNYGDVLNKVPAKIEETEYKNPDNDARGLYKTMPCTNKGGTVYTVVTPTGTRITEEWRFKKETYDKLLADNRLVFPRGGDGKPRYKLFLSEKIAEGVLANTWLDNVSSNQEATKEIKDLFESLVFDTPKPIGFLTFCLSLGSAKDSIILDFFSGSAATAHAVLKLNASEKDGSHRKFIMVQLPEVTNEKSEARKAGYNTICEIGKERIRRAGRKIKEEAGLPGQDLDIGFRVLKLADSNMEDVFSAPDKISEGSLFVDNVKADRTSEDLLFQVMLQLGIELSSSIEKKKINGKEVFSVRNGFLMATFDENVDEATIMEIAQSEPVYFVMRDASAENDNVLDNFEQLFRHYSPDTIRRIL